MKMFFQRSIIFCCSRFALSGGALCGGKAGDKKLLNHSVRSSVDLNDFNVDIMWLECCGWWNQIQSWWTLTSCKTTLIAISTLISARSANVSTIKAADDFRRCLKTMLQNSNLKLPTKLIYTRHNAARFSLRNADFWGEECIERVSIW